MNNVRIKSTPGEVFLYFFWAVTLYVSLSSFVWLLFKFIDQSFPEITDYPDLGTMRWIIAELVVLFPIFLGISWLINKQISFNPEGLNIRARSWSLSLTLFLVSAIFVSDLVYLLYDFLAGELTIRFILKALTVLVITAGVFGYYLWDLNNLWRHSEKSKLIAWFVSFFVITGIGFGFYIVGTPQQQHNINLDRKRVYNLQDIERSVSDYYRQNSNLPKKLLDLKDYYQPLLVDPQTKEPYEYRVLGQESFELCATFKTRPVLDYSYTIVSGTKWAYEPGRNCFTLKVGKN